MGERARVDPLQAPVCHMVNCPINWDQTLCRWIPNSSLELQILEYSKLRKSDFCGPASGVFLDGDHIRYAVAIPRGDQQIQPEARLVFHSDMLNYSRTKTSIYQESREASRDTLHAIARDDVYRRRLGALVQRQDDGSATSAAESVMASFRTVNQLDKAGAEKSVFDNTIDETEPAIIIERAQFASLWYFRWYFRCDNGWQNGDRVSFTQIYPDYVPILPQTASTIDFHARQQSTSTWITRQEKSAGKILLSSPEKARRSTSSTDRDFLATLL